MAGTISNGWAITASVQPWREGRSLFDVLGDDPCLLPAVPDAPAPEMIAATAPEMIAAKAATAAAGASSVSWGGMHFDILECSCSEAELGQLLSHNPKKKRPRARL